MAASTDHKLNKALFNDLMRGKHNQVMDTCQQIPCGPCHVLTIRKNTVLHMAIYSKQEGLVRNLIRILKDGDRDKLYHQNESGNTVLHEAAILDDMVTVATELLKKAPELHKKMNRWKETALFRAARYGKKDMFEFLEEVVRKENLPLESFLRRDDGKTILHAAVATENFDMAHYIAEKYEYLVDKKDKNQMTALQILVCNPSVFGVDTESRLKPFLKPMSFSFMGMNCQIFFHKKIMKEEQRYESAIKLANFLIERDTSWDQTESTTTENEVKSYKYGHDSGNTKPLEKEKERTASETMNGPTGKLKYAETPLFLATKFGMKEIVKKILDEYPQAVEYIDNKGQNILHVAIRYHQMEIFNIVEGMGMELMAGLTRELANNGNSILHMVGVKGADETRKNDMRNPATILKDDLLLFEQVEKITVKYFFQHLNNDGKTAEELFEETNHDLLSNAKEWMQRTAQNCSIVAVLIATVAFAAAYTVPGGSNQETGYPVLLRKPFFIVFTITDVLSVALALTAVIVFLSVLTSPFRFRDFKRSLPLVLLLGLTLLIISVSMMMLSFGSTIILMIRNGEKWSRVALSCAALLPVTIFVFAYLPLYISLVKDLGYFFKIIGMLCPRFRCSKSNPNPRPDCSSPAGTTSSCSSIV